MWSTALQEAVDLTLTDRSVSLLETDIVVNDQPKTIEIVMSRVVSERDALLGATLVLRDVTQRKAVLQAERLQTLESGQRSNAERRHLRQLFQHAPGLVLVTDGPSHAIELANDTFYKMAGRRELVGRPSREALPHFLCETMCGPMDRVYAECRLVVLDGIPFTRPPSDGPERLIYVDFVFRPLFDDQAQVSGVFCHGHDVTSKFEAEAAFNRSQRALEQALASQAGELHSTQRALEQSQKLEAIGKLTGGVAHDFNNVLQIIGANLQLLRTSIAGQGKPQERVASALETVDRGAKLSSQLLAFARKQPLAPVALDLGRRLRTMDDLLRRALGETVEIEVSVAARLWTTLADAHQLENVVLNLVINARDAMPDGGKLTIETSNAMLDEIYAKAESEVVPGPYVLLAISDTGHGMSPEVMKRAFDPFFTTKREGEGTGLGLSMAYGFAKQSDGHIKIYSEEGAGTTIKLYLPRTVQAAAPERMLESGAVIGGTETILVAEDDPGVQATVVATLEDLGYRVLRANDASAALAIVQSGARVDLLFTDVVMPGPLRSPDLARMAKELLPNLVVLYTSGYTRNAIVHGGRLDAGVELLSKPYRQDQLARKVRALLGDASAAVQAQLLAAPVADRRLRILVVEDDIALKNLTVELLSSLDCDAVGVESAELAIPALADTRFDMLLADLGLPGMSRGRLAAHAIASHPEIKIVLASGARVNEAADAFSSGLNRPACNHVRGGHFGSLALHRSGMGEDAWRSQ